MKRAVQQQLETAIAKALLRGEFGEEDVVRHFAVFGLWTLVTSCVIAVSQLHISRRCCAASSGRRTWSVFLTNFEDFCL